MSEKIRILFLSANPWTTSRILVDEEAREVFEKIQEGTHRDKFELHKHAAIRPVDLQRLLLMYRPHIVHFSGHGSKKHRIVLGGTPGRGKLVDLQGLVDVFALYRSHVRLVFLNACFTKLQARALSNVIDFAIGTGKAIGDKGSVAFAGAFYRALSFGMPIKQAFESAKAELALTKTPRTNGIELFIREGLSRESSLSDSDSLAVMHAPAFLSESLSGPGEVFRYGENSGTPSIESPVFEDGMILRTVVIVERVQVFASGRAPVNHAHGSNSKSPTSAGAALKRLSLSPSRASSNLGQKRSRKLARLVANKRKRT